jgi:predicted nuclease of predicted toxin-antitoxin system
VKRLLLDENIPQALVAVLRDAGHDVVHVTQLVPGAPDTQVLDLARSQGRLLLTLDSDFGELLFRQGIAPVPAIIYFRLHPMRLEDLAHLALTALAWEVEGGFVVATREGMRRRPF